MSALCSGLHKLAWSGTLHSFPFKPGLLPSNGIYVLFEAGECSHGGRRIVRVGSHTGDNQLVARLDQHFLREKKDRSIFRKNIGRALLNRVNDPFLAEWEIDLTSRQARQRFANAVDLSKQKAIETEVTKYIQSHFTFVVFRVDDRATRLCLESRMISTISLCKDCRPSNTWLGLGSPKARIRMSGVWLVNELYKYPLSCADVEQLTSCVI